MRVLPFLLLAVAVPTQAATRYGLFVGNNVGSSGDGALRWAEEDARRVRDLFVELGGISNERVVLLLGNSAESLQHELVRLRGQVEEARRRGDRTEVWMFYSGHGDADTLHMGSTSFLLNDLQTYLELVPADAVINVIDACRSSTLKRGRGKGARHGPAFDINLIRQSGPSGRVLITSAGADEIAQESDALRASFFTHHFLSGLRGGADRDANGEITLAEIYRYVFHRTLSSSHGVTAAVQHPSMEVDLKGEGEIVVTDLRRARSSLIFSENVAGDILVVNDYYSQVVAELRKEAGLRQTLALPAGRFRVQLRKEGKVYAGEVALDWGGQAVVSMSSLEEQPLLAAMEKGIGLNPRSWIINAAPVVGLPLALGGGVFAGARIGAEHWPLDMPLFFAADIVVGTSNAQDQQFRYRHNEGRLSVGIGYALYWGPVRVTGSLNLGVTLVHESEEPIGFDEFAAGWTAGPTLGLELGVRVPVYGPFGVLLGAAGQTGWLKVNGKVANRLGMHGFVGGSLQL